MKLIKLNKKSLFVLPSLILITLSFSAVAGIQNINSHTVSTIEDNKNVPDYVDLILKDTEDALSLVESNPRSSLLHVKNAIENINLLKNTVSHDTHAINKSPLIVNESKEYWFVYPSINQHTLQNKIEFPTIYSKLQNNILYKGVNDEQNDEVSAYFDYAFAHASLLTAREALVANNIREATSSLKWVFEAIYLSPDFNVAAKMDDLIIDNLIDQSEKYPLVSQSNY